MDFDNAILELTCRLCDNLKLSRAEIQNIISIYQDFIYNHYNPLLLSQLNKSLFQAVEKEVMDTIDCVFDTHKDPFKNFDSEAKRFRLYKSLGLYAEPEICELKKDCKSKLREKKICYTNKTTSIYHLPLKWSLKKLLEMDGLLQATLSYMNDLMGENQVLTNFDQGTIWKKIVNSIKTGIALPLLLYFDDLETGDSQGSHAGKNAVGTVNAQFHVFLIVFLQNYKAFF